jgi:hypothetical protein
VAEIRSFPFSPAHHYAKTPEMQREQASSVNKALGYRVDTVPWPVRPLYLSVAWAAGGVLYLYYFFAG